MLYSIIGMVAYIILAPLLGGLLAGIDRKINAKLQGRIGPSVLQPFYDVMKLFNKETISVNKLQMPLVISFLVFIIASGALFFGGFNLLLVLFMLTTASMFFILAASSTSSPFSHMGAQREMLQMLSYEPMVLLVAVGFYMATGSFNVSEIIKADIPAIAYLPGIFIGYLFILTIKFRKSPFDLATSHHAHQEVVKGITTEMSGKMMAMIEISHWYENIMLVGIIALFFAFAKWWAIPIAIAGALVAYFIEIIIDNTSARVKWDVMLRYAWIVTLAAGAVNVVVLNYLL